MKTSPENYVRLLYAVDEHAYFGVNIWATNQITSPSYFFCFHNFTNMKLCMFLENVFKTINSDSPSTVTVSIAYKNTALAFTLSTSICRISVKQAK